MIRRYILHIEAHRNVFRYRPRISFKRAPRHGDRVVDGGVPGTLKLCPTCQEGFLHEADPVPAWKRAPNPTPPEVIASLPDNIQPAQRTHPYETEPPERLELDYTLGTKVYKPGDILLTQRSEYVVEGVRDDVLYLIRKDVFERRRLLGGRNRTTEDNTASVSDSICKCRNTADEFMPPSVRIGDAEAKRRGLWSTKDCPIHREV